MNKQKMHKPTIIIVDNIKDRCLREEAALDKAIKDKGIYALGMSNYGDGYIARTGISEEKLPYIEVDSLHFFPPHPNEELTYERLCRFLEMLVTGNVIRLTTD